MQRFRFGMRISPEGWLEFYRQPRSVIVAHSDCGKKIQIAARHFQRFVTQNGVSGRFVLTLNDRNDFVSLAREVR